MSEAILFDFDGVIVDSDPWHERAKVVTLEKYCSKIKKSDWLKIKNFSINQIYKWLVQKKGVFKEDVSEEDFVGFKRTYFAVHCYRHIKFMPGAINFLKKIKKSGYKLVLVTSTRRKTLNLFADHSGLLNYFDFVVTGDEVKKLKPDPEAYVKAIKFLKLKPEECLVIEDNELGVRSGCSAGCRVIGKIGTLTKRKLIEFGASGTFQNFSELTSFLNSKKRGSLTGC